MQTHDQTNDKLEQGNEKLDYIISSKCSGGQCVGVAKLSDGGVKVCNTSDDSTAPLTFTREEWVDFVAGVRNNEFNV